MRYRLHTKISTILTLIILLLLLKENSIALTNVSLDSRVYRDLEWLAALGFLPTYSAGIKPLSRLEIAALIIEGKGRLVRDTYTPKGIVASTLKRLKKNFHQEINIIKGLAPKQNFLKPIEKLRTIYIYQKKPEIPENEYGQNGIIDADALIDLSCRGQFWDRMGFYLRPFWFIGDQSNFEFIEAYLQYQFKHLSLAIGKEAFWWGQGIHGTPQLTNNAKPFDMIHLTSNPPLILPSFLRYLGLCRFSFFLTELEKDRPYSGDEPSHPTIKRPKFCGLKISFKINPSFEVGHTRTFLFEKWKDFGDTLLAMEDNEGTAGNQIAGFDWRINLPFRLQPITLYGDHAGEDEAGNLPYAWLHLVGIYLPAIGPFSQIRFRAEYANIHCDKKAHVWYIHSTSREGLRYTYEGRIMGHHMDRNSEDLYLALEWEPHSKFKIHPAFDFEQRWTQGKATEKQLQYLLTMEYSWTQNLIISTKVIREFLENKKHTLGANEDNSCIYLSFQFML